jgi:hypothetical protein
VLGLAVLADQLGRLDAVDVGHVHVEQDHGELAREQLAQRVGARGRHHQVLPKLFEHDLERQPLVRQVVYDKDVDLVIHGEEKWGRTPFSRGLR